MKELRIRFSLPFVYLFVAFAFAAGCASTSPEKKAARTKETPTEQKAETDKGAKEKATPEGSETASPATSPGKSEHPVLDEERKKRDEDAQRQKESERERFFDGTRYVGPAKEEFGKGVERYFSQGCDAAFKEWEKAFAQDKDNGSIAYNIALCLERQGKLDEARQWYEKAVTARQIQEQALYNMVLLDERKKNLRADEYHRLADTITDVVVRNNFLAWLYLKAKNYDECIKHAKAALKEDEQNVDAMVSLGTAYFYQGMLELAQMIFSTAEQINPDNFRLQRIYGFLEYKQGNKQRATEHFRKSKKLNPELPEVSNMLAVLAMEIEDFSTAKQELDFALKISPDFLEAKFNLAVALKGLKEYKQARDILVSLEKDPATPKEMMKDIIYNLAILYLDNDIEGDGQPARLDTATAYLTRYLAMVDKRDKEEQKRIAEYLKEAQTEKKKIELRIKQRQKMEAKRKKEEEEERQYQQLMKDLEEAKAKDTIEAYVEFLAKHADLGEEHDARLFVQKRIEALKAGNAPPLSPETPHPPEGEKTPKNTEP